MGTMKTQLQRIAQLSANRAWERLALRWPQSKLGMVPIVVMNGRLKTTAGRAWLEAGKIDLSVSLMTDFPRQFCMDTVPHECAHIAAFRVFGYGLQRGESHGKPWAMMMQDLGLPANVYHTMLEQRSIKQLARKG